MNYLIFLLLLISTHYTLAGEFNFSGETQLQTRSVSANEETVQAGTDSNQFQFATLLLNTDFSYKDVVFHASLFGSYLQASETIEGWHLQQFNSPAPTVRRNLFNTTQEEVTDTTIQSSLVSEAYFQINDKDFNFKAGRFSINYGNGLFFNPINPFFEPAPFRFYQPIIQANDGTEFHFYNNNQHKVWLYLMGDNRDEQNYRVYEYGGIARTIVMRGEVKLLENTKANYLLGEDQQRHRAAFELSHHLNYLKGVDVNLQYANNSKRLDHRDDSEGTSDFLVNTLANISSNLRLGLEYGASQQDELYPVLSETPLYLFQESYVGILANYSPFQGTSFTVNLINSKESLIYSLAFAHKIRKSWEISSFFISQQVNDTNELANKTIIHPEFGLGMNYSF